MTTRVKSLVCWSLFRVLVPLILLAACVVRYNALSFLYVIFLLICPLLRSPTEFTIKGGTGLYLKLLIVLGALGTLAHIIFHITLAALDKPYGFDFANYVGYLHFSKPSISCQKGSVSTKSGISSSSGNFSISGSTNDNISRQIAVERLDGVPAINIIRLIVPDLAVLITAILVFVICYVLLKVPEGQDTELPTAVSRTRRKRTERFLHFFGTFLVLLFLAASGIIVPSILGAFYFLSFLYISTWWAFYNALGYKFAVYRFVVLVWSGLHLCVLHLYQFPFFQDLVDPKSLEARIIGLTGIIKTDCERTWYVDFHDASQWPWFVNPGILLLLYFTLAIESRQWLHRKELIIIEEPKARTRSKKSRKSSERQVALQDLSQRERLVENENASYSTFDKEGSPAMSAAFDSDEDEADGDTKPAKKKKQPKEDVKRPYMVSIFVYAMKQSYVLALIAMMAWSITFHSWLTFVLLLGACIVWMVPKSRELTLCISPLLVVYGECLLIIQYVFGMNLKNELPEVVNGVKLNEVGLKTFPYPCLQLAVQILFTAMFWLTLRQFMRERKERKYHLGYQMEDVSPNGDSPQSPSARSFFSFPSRVDSVDGYDSSTMKKIGKYMWSVLAKYWIFVCAVMMLLISIQEVVIYRIIYMILFLFFVLTFQLSYRLWRLTMFLFWWIVIIYSMAVLIILYTYQFSDFPMYWKNGTHLSDEVLKDIGLEQFNTATLFVKLLTPTSFLIVIILQVHYFHKEFLTISDLNRYSKDSEEVDTQPPGPAISETEGGTTTDTDHVVITKTKRWRRKLTECWNKLWQLCSDWWKILSEIFWRLMEIHIFKIVVFVIIMVAVHEVTAVSAVYVFFLAIFLPITGAWPCMAVICQFWTAIVLLAKTIYQLNLVEKDYWITNCTANFSIEPTIIPLGPTVNTSSSVVNSTGSPLLANSSGYNSISGGTGFSASNGVTPDTNGTINQALWVGFAKTSNLSYYLSNYIGILLILVLYKLIKCHQSQYYKKPRVDRPPPGVIFDEIKRPEADRGLLRCSKYFANFFFYKFGLQLCYIMLAVTICVRVDVYSVIYAVILGILLVLSRRGNALIWPLITIILAVMLPLEFLICLGLPKGLCIEYPWSYIEIFERNLEKWLYLPDYNFPPRAIKLIADTIQLLLICLQWQVFRRESSEGDSHPGGSNKDILEEVEASTPINVPDFTGHAKSYLDVLKIGFFTYMYWVTLFIMFITGATRINLFSMGYVIAVFVFMWYGQEFLLLPLRVIRRRWNMLIGYTFFVLFMKAVLQLLGCVYIDKLYTDQCWLIQLLGLTCLNPSHIFNTGDCKVEEDDTGLAWDVICFTFLLLQMRIYNSHYFRHVVVMNQAQHNLASRGAELINQTLIESVLKQKEEERQVLDNIKKKMDAIKEKQKHVKKDFVVPDEHFQTIRSGDYYLFEEESESEEEVGGKKVKDSVTFGQDDEEDETPNPLQLISTAIHSGTDAAIDQAEDAEDKDKDQQTKDKEQEDEDEEEDIIDKTGTVLKFIQKLLESLCDSIIETCNNISKNYRMVADQLEDEMNKERQGIIRSLKLHHESGHKSLEMEDQSIEGRIDGSAEDGEPRSTDLVSIHVIAPDAEVKKTPSEDSLDGKKQDKFEQSKSKVYLLLEALYYLLISRTELICYFLMILDQIVYASLLSLPLPLMVFLWGMLSVPRPSKSFWITAITYTEAIIVVKYLFQFGFWPWNKDQTNLEPFYPPRIIGIEQINGYATVDLILLLALFIHRSILKRYGLWKDAEEINSDFDKVEEKISPHGSPAPKREDTELVVSGSTAQTSGTHSSIEESLEDPNGKKKKAEMSTFGKIVNPFKEFYNQVTNPDYNATTDVYASMFFCDFINFFIVVFGYTAFGPQQSVGTGDVSSYIQEDKVPIPFLIMLVVQFILIIIDRALYLRKNVLGKFIFQIVLVILLHVWMFFVLPEVTKRKFSENRPAQLWYFVKCVYFGLSAYQIRSSYPTRILGNFLTKSYNYLNLFLYKGFLAIPFLLELRVLMDWIWTDTTMAIGSWLQMEDIYANVYQLKCWRDIERNYPTPRGFKKKSLIKYGVGGLLLILIIFIIWFPLVIFSFANTVFKVNPPTECTVTMTVNGFQPIYKMTVQTEGIRALSSAEYKTLKETFNGNLNAIAFLTAYEPEDITEIQLNGQSTSLWGISPPSKDELIKQLASSNKARLEFHASFLRTPASASAADTLSFQIVRTLDSTEQTTLRDILTNTTQTPLVISKLFPRFLKLPSKGSAAGIKTLNDAIGLSKVQLNLQGNDPIVEWWKVDELMTGTVISPSPGKPDNVVHHISLITFNARVAPSGFSFITNYGIIGLYISFILLIGRILRLSTSGLIGNITYNELPYIDNALQLCLDLYLVREMGEFRLEEDLYAKLIFFYRSAETRVKWTRLPNHLVVTDCKKNN
ncbi:piezo-type mechanosensitive ion channel component 2-like isoform X6 [Mytilus edulis]|uniref:piezo-type mechanosensitive ion channel component 2-like isoform X6 n=1 Tax=Mytilus edulis TaxID=6550 RepID=UPI0039EEE1EA